MNVICRALRVGGGGGYCLLVVFQDSGPTGDVRGIFFARIRGEFEIGTKEGRTEFRHQFLHGVSLRAKAMTAKIAIKVYISSHYDDFVTGDVLKASQVFHLWAQTYSRDMVPFGDLTNEYGILGQYDRSLASARRTLELGPCSGLAYGNLAATYLALNRLDEASAILNRAKARGIDSMELGLRSSKVTPRPWPTKSPGTLANRESRVRSIPSAHHDVPQRCLEPEIVFHATNLNEEDILIHLAKCWVYKRRHPGGQNGNPG